METTENRLQRVREIFTLFLRLGVTAFGGPAVSIAMMQDEVVQRRRWLTSQQFLDLVGATNLVPGPNAVEMAIHIGLLRAGWWGFLAGGVGLSLPAFLIVLALAVVYGFYGTTPQVTWLLYGIKPVVIAILLQALWTLGKKALKNRLLLGIGIAVLAGYVLRVNEVFLLLGGGLIVLLWSSRRRIKFTLPALFCTPWLGFLTASASPFGYLSMFLSFLKIGFIWYGSGYVLMAFLRAEFVSRLGWLTEQQLLDAIAVGQVTPGPLFTSVTFIGYILGGYWGALLATLGIFLPSFLFVALAHKVLIGVQKSTAARSLLDGVNAAALGLMAAVALQLGLAAVTDWISGLILLAALVLLLRFKVHSTGLITGGALIGWVSSFIR